MGQAGGIVGKPVWLEVDREQISNSDLFPLLKMKQFELSTIEHLKSYIGYQKL